MVSSVTPPGSGLFDNVMFNQVETTSPDFYDQAT